MYLRLAIRSWSIILGLVLAAKPRSDRRRMMIDPDHERLSIRRQCELVSISRASFYRQPAGETPGAVWDVVDF
jgi:hypothetical protein